MNKSFGIIIVAAVLIMLGLSIATIFGSGISDTKSGIKQQKIRSCKQQKKLADSWSQVNLKCADYFKKQGKGNKVLYCNSGIDVGCEIK